MNTPSIIAALLEVADALDDIDANGRPTEGTSERLRGLAEALRQREDAAVLPLAFDVGPLERAVERLQEAARAVNLACDRLESTHG